MAKIFDSEFKPSVDRPGSESNLGDLKHDGSSALSHVGGLLSDIGHMFKDGVVDPVVAGTRFVGNGVDNLGNEVWDSATKAASAAAAVGATGIHAVKEFGSEVYDGVGEVASSVTEKASSVANKAVDFGKEELGSVKDGANRCVDEVQGRTDAQGDVSIKDLAKGIKECVADNVSKDPIVNKIGDLKPDLGNIKIHVGDKNDALKQALEDSTKSASENSKPEKVTDLSHSDPVINSIGANAGKTIDMSAGMSM